MPTTAEMFSDVKSASERSDRLDTVKERLSSAIKRHDTKADAFVPFGVAKDNPDLSVGIHRGAGPATAEQAKKLEALAERFSVITKDLSGEDAARVASELSALQELRQDLTKDISSTVPGNLHPYDLEAPAKVLVPRFTPLRNQVARQRGQGTAREFRRILGYTNAGMGGVADIQPFFNSETALNGGSTAGLPSFGALNLIRGQKISYAMDIKTANYVEMSLSDVVGYKAQFANLGFEDSRQLSQMALLWGHLLGEEKALLYARGASGSGYEGAVASPTATAAASGTTGTIPPATYSVKIASFTGGGQSVPGTANGALVVSAGNNIVVTVTSEPAGALSYAVYVGTAGSEKFQGNFVPGGTTGNTITLASFNASGAAIPTADSSFNANGYDGYLSVLSDPAQAGYFARFNQAYAGKNIYGNATAANNLGDSPFQDAFASLYASVYADPEELWLAPPQRRQLTDFIRSLNNTAAAYRINIDEGSDGNMHVGGLVTGIVNETTGRMVDLRVHPYMPVGASFLNSRVLPFPDSNIGETSVVTAVQDYMSVDWPSIQFTWDASTYWFGTFVHYAPKWSGCILGLQ